jgi:prepilin-type N-terminal cleavage/methylation domain-containing protein
MHDAWFFDDDHGDSVEHELLTEPCADRQMMSPSVLKPKTNQQGFSLLETMIAMILLSVMVVYGLYWQKIADSTDKGRSLGQQYVTLNDAVSNYMVTHSQALSALKPVCSETAFSYDPSGTFAGARSKTSLRMAANCALVVAQNTTVVNGLQPTVEELALLGFYPKQDMYLPLLRMSSVVKEANADGSAPNALTAFATARFFINIEQVCLQRGSLSNPNQMAPVPTTPAATGCPITSTTALKSLIFNSQPYFFNDKTSMFAYPALIGAAVAKIGADALLSHYADTKYAFAGELRSQQQTITNPIRYVDLKNNINLGLNGIIAMRGGYGAAYAQQHSRVDGSNVPTADWSFGGHSVSDVKDLAVLNQLKAEALSANKLKLADKVAGTACDASEENIATQQETFLVCKQGVWRSPLSGSVNAKEYYEIVFKDDPAQTLSVAFVYCQDVNCSTPASIGTLSGTATKTMTTQLKKSDWLPLIQGFSQANVDPASPTNLGVWLDVSADGNHQITLNYQDRKDLAKFKIRFYRINL